MLNKPNNAICLGCHGFVTEVSGLFDEGAGHAHSKDMADIMVRKDKFGGIGNACMHFDNHASFSIRV